MSNLRNIHGHEHLRITACLMLSCAAWCYQPAVLSQGSAPEPGPTQAVSGPTAAPGIFEAERKQVLEKILAAKNLGCGVAPFMAAFNQIEDSVRAQEPQDKVQKRIASLSSSINDQLQRLKDLKSRAAGQPASSGQSSSSINALLPPGAANNSQLVDQLKQKFGGQVPNISDPAVADQIKQHFGGQLPNISDPSVREKLLQSDMAKEYLKNMSR